MDIKAALDPSTHQSISFVHSSSADPASAQKSEKNESLHHDRILPSVVHVARFSPDDPKNTRVLVLHRLGPALVEGKTQPIELWE